MSDVKVLCEDIVDVNKWWFKTKNIYEILFWEYPIDWENIRKDHFNFEITEYNALHTIDITDYFLKYKEYFVDFLQNFKAFYIPPMEWEELDAKCCFLFQLTDDDRIICNFAFVPNHKDDLRYVSQMECFMEKMNNE